MSTKSPGFTSDWDNFALTMEVDGELAKPPSASQLLSLFQPTSSFWNTVPELPSAVTTVPAEQSSFGRADHPAHTLDVGIRLRHPGRNSAPDQGNGWLMKYYIPNHPNNCRSTPTPCAPAAPRFPFRSRSRSKRSRPQFQHLSATGNWNTGQNITTREKR